MKLAQRLRTGLYQKTTKKLLIEKITEKLFIIADDLNKGCILEFKNFSLEERKEIVESLRSEDLIVVGCDSEKKNEFFNERYYVAWDSSCITKIENLCENCYDMSCLDGYRYPPNDEYCKYNGKTYYTYDTKGGITVEKLEKNYKVLLFYGVYRGRFCTPNYDI